MSEVPVSDMPADSGEAPAGATEATMVAEGPTADFDRQSVVEYMTTGTTNGRPYEPAGSASGKG